jgi:hypothetical protein
LTTPPPSCADRLEIWEPQLPEALTACAGLKWCSFTSNHTCLVCPLLQQSCFIVSFKQILGFGFNTNIFLFNDYMSAEECSVFGNNVFGASESKRSRFEAEVLNAKNKYSLLLDK